MPIGSSAILSYSFIQILWKSFIQWKTTLLKLLTLRSSFSSGWFSLVFKWSYFIWSLYISVSRFATSCSPWLEPLGFMLILPFVAILSFGPGMKNDRKWRCLFILAHSVEYKEKKNPKSILAITFWLEGHTDLRSMPLSYIFHALSRDTPLGHVYRAQPNSQIAKLAKYLDISTAVVIFWSRTTEDLWASWGFNTLEAKGFGLFFVFPLWHSSQKVVWTFSVFQLNRSLADNHVRL